MDVVFAAVLGAIAGSFLNVAVYRVPRGESVVSPPSRCPGCGTSLGAADLVPILSYLVLRGRCRHCGMSMSWRYVIIEAAAAGLAALSIAVFGPGPRGIAAAVFLLLLLALSAIDLEHFLLPDRIVGFGLAVGIPLVLVRDWPAWTDGALGLAAGGVLFAAIAVISRGGMGGGDVKLAVMIGLYLGWRHALLAFTGAFVLGGLVGVVLMALGIKGRKDHLPFGPFLAMAAAGALFAGDPVLLWYFGLR